MIPLADIPAPVLKFVVGFWRRRWIILAVAWAIAIPGWFAVGALPDTYSSSTKIHVKTDSMLDRVLQGVAPRQDFQDRIDYLRLRLLARPNVEQVAREIGIDLEARSALEFARAIDDMTQDVKVRAIRNNYFEISFTGDNPVRSQQVVNGFLNIFIESDLSESLSGMDTARSVIDSQIASFDEQITERQRQIAAFRRQYASELNAPARLTQSIENAEEELSALETQLDDLNRRRGELEQELLTTPRAAKAADPEILRLKERLLDLQTQYTDEYPAVQAVRSRIRELEGRLDREDAVNEQYTRLQTAMEYLDRIIAETESQRTEIRAKISDYESSLNLAPAALADLDDIQRGLTNLIDKRRTLEDKRLALNISAGVGESGEQIEYDIVEEPIVPLEPTGPPRLIFTLAVLVVAGGAGAGVAIVLILLDRSFSQSEDLERAYGIPVIGTVSIVAAGVATAKRLRSLGFFAVGAGGLVLTAAVVGYMFMHRTSSFSFADAASYAPTRIAAVFSGE